MKKLLIGLSVLCSVSAFASTFAPLTNVEGKILINSIQHSVSTNGDDGKFLTIPTQITFDGKAYNITNASSSHVSAEVEVDGYLTMVTLYSFKFENTWSWLKNTVFNSHESNCHSGSDYFFTITHKPIGTGYAFFGNCLTKDN